MGSADRWKSKEREVRRMFENIMNFQAQRTPGSGGRDMGFDADVVVVPKYSSDDEVNVLREVEEGDLSFDELITVEVKYRKDGGWFKHVYHQHLRMNGLNQIHKWEDGMFTVGGEVFLRNQLSRGKFRLPQVPEEYLGSPNKKISAETAEDTDHDILAFRGSKKGFPMIWTFAFRRSFLEKVCENCLWEPNGDV